MCSCRRHYRHRHRPRYCRRRLLTAATKRYGRSNPGWRCPPPKGRRLLFAMMSERSHKKTPQLRFSTPASFPEKILDPGGRNPRPPTPPYCGLGMAHHPRHYLYFARILHLGSHERSRCRSDPHNCADSLRSFAVPAAVAAGAGTIAQWMGSAMVVTSHRIIFRSGIFRKETLSVSLAWTQLVEVDQSFMAACWDTAQCACPAMS